MNFKIKKWLKIIGIIVVAVTVSAVIGNLSNGFQDKPADWGAKTVNESNLYQSMTFADKDGVILDGADGVTAKLLENNELKITGTAEKELEVLVASCTLKANTAYVFDSSMDEGSQGTVYMAVVTSDGETLASCYGEPVVIEASKLSADTVVEIRLYVAEEYKVGSVTLKPVLCEGDSADDLVKFYE